MDLATCSFPGLLHLFSLQRFFSQLMQLQELHNRRCCPWRINVAAGMDSRYHRSLAGGRIARADRPARLAGASSVIDLAVELNRLLLESEWHNVIVRSSDHHHGPRQGEMLGGIELAGADSKSRQHLAAFGPEQVTEGGAVGKSRGINARVIYRKLLAHGSQHGIEKFQVAIVQSRLAGLHLPARKVSLWINLARRFKPLRIHNNGRGPECLQVHALAAACMVPPCP